MDEDLRREHRLARSGAFNFGRHAALIDKWIVIDGVRTSYRGILKDVLEVGGGVAILFMSNCRALESLADTNNEVLIGDFEVYTHAILGTGEQPKAWGVPK